MMHVGDISKRCLYAHLHSIGVKIFGTGYTDKELAVYTKVFGAERQKELLDKPAVEVLDLSLRARRGLFKLGITTISQLLERTEIDLLRIKNLGEATLGEIKTKLAAEGFSLKS
jgi:DNA-directed RNA polymerase alpha subunit